MEGVANPFTLEGRVSRAGYAATGLGLMLLKYGCEVLAVGSLTGKLWTPRDYLVSLYSLRAETLAGAPDWFLLALAMWTLPFVWIAAAMTLRRTRDLGCSPWWIVCIFVPLLSYVTMLCFATWQPAARAREQEQALGKSYSLLGAGLMAIGVTAVLSLTLAVIGARLLESYGLALFFGLPFVGGLQAGYLFNRGEDRGVGPTLVFGLFVVASLGMGVLGIALEGAVCLVMALPVLLPPVLFGTIFGRAIALARARRTGVFVSALLVPPFLWLEPELTRPVEFEVVSALEIAASPEEIWPNVIGFSDLPAPQHWLFATGIAYPLRARIEGEGVGAVRRCEFSTGAFVEPITAWEPPLRLAFDVTEHPDPMEEWSFYARVHPPHLERSFRSLRGEFRLVPLADGRTRLEGRTWYALELAPLGYWRLLSDAIVHRIHARVLTHIRALSERE